MDEQPRKILVRLGVNRICLCVTEDAQCNHAIQHCWINGGEAIAAFTNSFNHPAFRCLKRAPSQRPNAKRPQEFEHVVDSQKEIAPCPELVTPWQPQIALLGAERVKLVQLLFTRQNPR